MERNRRGTQLPQLPEGLTLSDLRFVNPEIYPLDMAMKGWQVLLKRDVGGNAAKVSWSLERGVPEDFDLDTLKQQIGVLDEKGNALPGYHIGLASSPDAIHSLGKQVGIDDITDEAGNSLIYHTNSTDKTFYLLFNFTGFPMAKTMEVLLSLEQQFLPADFTPVRFERVAVFESKPKTIFSRLKDRLTRRRN